MSLNTSEKIRLPIIPLRGLVGFPGVQMNIEIVRPKSLKAFTAAATMHGMEVLLVTQKDISKDNIEGDDLYKVGVLAKIRHVVKNTSNNLSVVFEGLARATIEEIDIDDGFMYGTAEIRKEPAFSTAPSKIDALLHEVKNSISNLPEMHPTFTEEMRLSAEAITDP